MNRSEGKRHRFAAELLARLGRRVLVPWPVLTEVDLLLRARGHAPAARVFASSLHAGIHRLDVPTNDELATALALGERYPDSGVDLPGLTVMAISNHRKAPFSLGTSATSEQSRSDADITGHWSSPSRNSPRRRNHATFPPLTAPAIRANDRTTATCWPPCTAHVATAEREP
jgi:predicted nucleic acid-binding protein